MSERWISLDATPESGQTSCHAPGLDCIKAPSFKGFRLSKYIVYQISYFKRGSWRTWKYGISRVGASRPSGQISRCQTSMRARCRYVVKNRVTGWFTARSLEAGYITAYYMRHGHCPPGQYYSCR